ncbi:hypothetical protein HYH03_011266 [Edaphochlamys debaryana]|uniref:Uncharacterized protein n=1 Tax=Edaphochlamys debaryana TaxID=47281 RepID=A0A836BVC9_9CHLO|nr:hypothetical protein HYH03_011266 [Edaphochlamys debaryana]|eukprot:KAG2490315.1 hypothetical protein HYH03_011266 [Edaphochlamys debaryana]
MAAVAVGKALADSEDLIDADVRAQQAGAELRSASQSGGRTRLRAEDVIAAQEAEQQQQQQGAQDAAKK